MHAQPTGKTIELTERDIEIFKLLDRYRYLRTSFIHAFIGGDQTRLSKRLGQLFHEDGYLGRPSQQWQAANARYQPAIYELGPKGSAILKERGLLEQNPSTWLARGRMGAHRQFPHSMMICDILASIEVGTRHDPKLRFISWKEIIARSPTKDSDNPFQIPVSIAYTYSRTRKTHRANLKIVPDALFGIEYNNDGQKSYRFFAVEADRNSMPVFRNNLNQTSYLKKFLAYRQIVSQRIYHTHFGLPNFLVINVTINESHLKNIISLLDQLTEGKGSKYFLFKAVPSFASLEAAPKPEANLLVEPWQRAGIEDIRINET